MKIEIAKGVIHFTGIPALLLEALRALESIASTDDQRVEARFFQNPGETADGIDDDWHAFVHPDLHESFRSARDVVQSDLRGASEEDGFWALKIPLRHVDAWLNVLTQARLALHELHRFSERDLSGKRLPKTAATPRDEALVQMEFYGVLEEWLVQVVS